jgi:hypothetical protein
MRKVFCLFAVLLTVNAYGARLSNLTKPSHESVVVLSADVVKTIGVGKRRVLRGFLAGRYVLVGSDQGGDYYLNEKPGFLSLMEQEIPAYVPGRELPADVINKSQHPRTLNNGGFRIRKKGGEAQVFPFYIDEPAFSGSALGLVGVAIVSFARGTIEVLKEPVDENLAKSVLEQIAMQEKITQ